MKVGDKVWFLFDERDAIDRTCVIDISAIDIRVEEIIWMYESNSTVRVTNVDENIYENELYESRNELVEHLKKLFNDFLQTGKKVYELCSDLRNQLRNKE